MKTYYVNSYKDLIDWQKIEVLTIDTYPWYEAGLKQPTFVQLAKSTHALHIKVRAVDCHSSASELKENGSVYLDSCFEFFFTPGSPSQLSYVNLEINCIGTVYLAVRDSQGKRRATSEQIGALTLETSLEKGKIKSVSKDDQSWYLDIVLPFALVEALYTKPIDWKVWHCNFYRCGGAVDDQYATWNPVVTPEPDFHQPQQFGQLIFI